MGRVTSALRRFRAMLGRTLSSASQLAPTTDFSRQYRAESLERRVLLATTIFSEGFEAAFPGAWTVNTSQSRMWGDTQRRAHGGTWSAHSAQTTSGGDTNTYVSNLNTTMTRTVNLSGYTSASISFWRWQNTESLHDYVRLKINGTEEFNRSVSTNGWESHTVPLDSYAGSSSVTIQFSFTSDGAGVPTGDAGVWLDDIVLTADTNSKPSAPTFNSVPSYARLYPSSYPNSPDDTNGPYSVTVDYTDPNGAADFQHTYLQLNGPSGVQSQTIMYRDLTTPVQWTGQGDHLTNLSASKVAITNGYRVTYSFQLKGDWTPNNNVDFEAFSLDKGGLESDHRAYNWNGIYDNNLRIADARLVNLVDNDGDGYYSSVTAEADADTSVSSRPVLLMLYQRDSGVANGGWYVWDTGSYTTNGIAADYKGATVTVKDHSTYDFGWELYDPSWYITNRWYDTDADVSNIKMEPAAEDVKIEAAYWLAPVNKTEGDVATARVRVLGYAAGTNITFDIYEDDGLLPSDYVTTLTGQVYLDSVSQAYFADVNWTTVWQSDQSGDPEFYFVARNGSVSATSSRDSAFEVTVAQRINTPSVPDARISNKIDRDDDGYSSKFTVSWDTTVPFDRSVVYARIFADAVAGDIQLAVSPQYTVVPGLTSTQSAIVHLHDDSVIWRGDFNLRIRVYDASTNQELVARTENDDTDLSRVKIEPGGDGSSLTAGKWTVIVHGLARAGDYAGMVGEGGWMRLLGDKIGIESGNVLVHTMDAGSATIQSAIAAGDVTDSTKHHVLLFNWDAGSDYNDGAFPLLNTLGFTTMPSDGAEGDDGYAEAAGDSLVALLHRYGIEGRVQALVGYSRGAVAASEAAQRLLREGKTVGKVIYLDGEGGGSNPDFSDPLVGLYQDEEFRAWNGVRTENYYSTYDESEIFAGVGLGGHSVAGAYNFNDGTMYSHSGASGFYHYLIGDLDAGRPFFEDGVFVMGGELVTKDTPASATGAPSATTIDAPGALELFNGNFKFNSTAGWWFSGGGNNSASAGGGTVTGQRLALAAGESRTHNWSYVPTNVTAVSFKLAVSVTDSTARLQVLWNGTPISAGVSIASAGETTRTLQLPVSTSGSVGRLGFRLDSGGAGKQFVYVDDIAWSTATVVNNLPTIGSIIGSPNPVVRPSNLTLAATGVGDSDGFVDGVVFYRDSNNDGVLQVGSDELLGQDGSSTDGWTRTISTATLPIGTSRFFARARDDDGDFSSVVTTTITVSAAPPEVRVVAGSTTVISGQTAVIDFGSAVQGSAAPQVVFQVWNDGDDPLTTSALTIPSGYTLVEGLSATIANGQSDTFTIRLDTDVAGTKTGHVRFANNDGDEDPFDFQITGSVTSSDTTAPTLLSAASRKIHGAAGAFDLPLALDSGSAATIEPRVNGPDTLVFAFSESIQVIDGTLSSNEFAITNATFSSATIDGSTLVLSLSGVLDQSGISVSMQGIADLAGNVLGGDRDVTILALYGDVNQSGSVSISDLQAVKNKLFETLSVFNFLFDVNLSGSITLSDMQQVKNNLFNSIA